MPAKPHYSIPSIPSLIKSCKNLLHLHQLHAHIIRKGLHQDHFIISHFLSLSTSLPYSASLFNTLSSPSTLLYNALLKAFSLKSHFPHTFSLFLRLMRSPSASPDNYTYPSVLKSCSNQCRLKEGLAVHGLALKSGFLEDVYIGSSLVDFYGKCDLILCARRVFDEMTERNVVSWTAMVVGYVNAGDLDSAKRVFDAMPERNSTSWNAVMGGLLKAGNLREARKMFDEMPQRDVVSYTAMIDGYAKQGDMASARALFEEAPEKDIVAWSALISGYAQNGQPNEAVTMFIEMESSNVEPDEFIMVSLMSACSQMGNLELAKWVDGYLSRSSVDCEQDHVVAALIHMNAKCGNMDRATTLFEGMPGRNLFSYCSMIQGLSVHGRGNEAVRLFDRMVDEGIIPDGVAFTVILTACFRGGLVEEGFHYFETMKNYYFIDPSPDHYACIVDLLSRAGQLRAAYEVLKSMPVESHHACAWGALLAACKLYGDVELGTVAASRLDEIEPLNAGNYVLMSDIYAAANQWLDVSIVRDKMKERGIRKIPGRCWV